MVAQARLAVTAAMPMKAAAASLPCHEAGRCVQVSDAMAKPAENPAKVDLAPVFAAATVEDAVKLLDPMLRDAVVPARLTAIRGEASWTWGTDQRGIDALRARLLAALAAHLVRHGVKRLGVCQANPCPRVFIDRGRARTRRYCCDRCNDRAAALAYRQRSAR
jgi:hypothetical protein